MNALPAYISLMRLNKPIGIWLVLWPAWWGALATGVHDGLPLTLILLLIGAAITRSAGCIVNDITDRELDRSVARTASRPLANGTLTMPAAIRLLVGLGCAAAIVCFVLGPHLFILAIPAIAFIVAYPWMKRLTWWPQAFLGLTFNLGVFFGWFALSDTLSPAPFLLYAAAISWTIGYDTIYAHQDILDDLKVGIKSTAIYFGEHNRLAVALCYAFTITFMLLAGIVLQMGSRYFLFWVLGSAHLLWQIARFEPYNATRSLELFQSNQWCGLCFALGLILGGL